MVDGFRDVVLERLAASSSWLRRRDEVSVVSPSDAGMSVAVEWVERRTPLLRETYGVSNADEVWAELGIVSLQHKLTQQVLKSPDRLETLLSEVSQRTELMRSPELAFRTTVAVLSGEEDRFGSDDDMWRLGLWAALGYWSVIQVVPPSIALFGDVNTDYILALRKRFNGGTLDLFASHDGDFALTDEGVAKVEEDGGLSLLVDPEFRVPRILRTHIASATAQAALVAAGVR